ncbi:sodium-dependent transporter [Clostridium botulinum]|uniref:Transporter n=1 Tax=Clostridium botulinum TaxID=1491 RepID=A0A9Q1ZD50_CLOBO|nr:sodium-dependent transporter [Clostridium botulinum]AEB77152.1 sodium-dependent symporter family protein [Clostridium botulinum BKT015925]KEH98734.1 transporter [Clostridium botulinum C/D str. Sp77]KEI00611.1 transporter [Clostridium botulinum D str. 16868]KLU75480.1 transporter [Clostridium botulinum V891]KOA74752.1 transporter [Clostridium botulinum]
MQEHKEREGFSSGLAAFFATLGSAVGLGNIWKFPYVVGSNGGAAFLLVYFGFILFIGLPIMISEFYIGRKTRKNVVGAIDELTSNKMWKGIGGFSILGAYLILFFYSTVGGWVYSYIFKSLRGVFNGSTTESVKQQFLTTTISPISPIVWQIVVIAVVSTILILGVKNGIEKITKTLMPVLFVLIIACDIKALMLPGVGESFKFLFKIDFSSLTSQGILMAMGLAFFKMSVGMGAMTTYGSYFTKKDNMIGTAAKVAISDTIVSLLVGVAVFSAVFTFNMQPAGGPGLLFMTVPLVFTKIPFGTVLLVLFFILASIAATTAMTSMCEVVVAYFVEQKGMSRTKSVLLNACILLGLGIFATLSADEGALLGGFTICGLRIFDIFDHLSSNIVLPLGGLLIAIFIGYFIPKEDLEKELSNNGELKIGKIIKLYRFILRYITPILVLVVFLSSIGIIK